VVRTCTSPRTLLLPEAVAFQHGAFGALSARFAFACQHGGCAALSAFQLVNSCFAGAPRTFASPPPDHSASVFVPAATIKPPDLSGGPLGCCSVFCVLRLASKAVAGYLPAMFGIGADPPQVHRCKVHGRCKFAPDLAAGIKLAPL
jgi:hypothetical protein